MRKYLLTLLALAALPALSHGSGRARLRAEAAPSQAGTLAEPEAAAPRNDRSPAAAREAYPYRSAAFDELVAESYREVGAGSASRFYVWLATAYEQRGRRLPGRERLGLEELLAAMRGELAAMPPGAAKAETEAAICAWLHGLIKDLLPGYSLTQGFELCNAARYGMRQCFLQSVLMTSWLQAMGVDAGVVMVYRNPGGYEANNSHATVLVKLSSGRDLIVDASYREPFVRQRGLFVRCPDYRYVDVIYQPGSARIAHYRATDGQTRIETAQLRPLDLGFLRSQFFYYRGERAPGGVLARKKTPEGLEASRRHLEMSLRLCPGNPLPAYMLSKVYRAQSENEKAQETQALAHRLYARSGWVPASLRPAFRPTGERG